MTECEFCGEEVEAPSHVVVNGRIFMYDEDTCSSCGYSDDELLEYVAEYQPSMRSDVHNRIEEEDG